MITRVRFIAIIVIVFFLATACDSRVGPLEEEPPQTEEELSSIVEDPTTAPQPTDTEVVDEQTVSEPTATTASQAEAATEAIDQTAAPEGDIVLQDVAVVKGNVCYQDPGQSASAVTLGAINLRDTVDVLGQSFTNEWIAVYLPSTQGDDNVEPVACWVKIDALDLDPDATVLPFFPRSETVVAEGVEVFDPALSSEVVDDTLCLLGPAASYGTVRGLVPGEFVNVIGKGVGDGWFVVGIPNTATTCWLDWDAVAYDGDAYALEIYAAPKK